MKPPQSSEKEIQNLCLSLLTLSGHYVWRNNSAVSFIQGRMVRAGIVGSSDIIGIHKKTGQFIALEIKKPSTVKTVSTHQRLFLDEIEKRGGIARVITSEKDIQDLLE